MTIVDESMKLIKLMRDNGWIQVSDDVIWDAIGKDISFSKVMRNHSVDVTRRMGGGGGGEGGGGGGGGGGDDHKPKKATKVKKSKDSVAVKKLSGEVAALKEAETGRAKWGVARWNEAQKLNVDPEELREGVTSDRHGMRRDGTWYLPSTPAEASRLFKERQASRWVGGSEEAVAAQFQPVLGAVRNGRPWPGI